MKKILFSTLFLLSSLLVFSQDESHIGFKLGLTAHPTFGWMKSDVQGVENDGLRAGFSYGLLGDFNFAENYAFSTALKLTTINGQTTENGSTAVYKLQYMEIPALIKLSTNTVNDIRFFGQFGLGNAFKVGAKQDIKSGSGIVTQDNLDISDKINFYRASLVLAGGAEFNLNGKTKLMGGLTFDNGFTDIIDGSGKLKNSYLGLNIGVFF